MKKRIYNLLSDGGQRIRSSTGLLVFSLLLLTTSGVAHAVTPWYSSKGNHIVVMNADGTVWSVGSNKYGQLGIGSDIDESHDPVQVTGIYKVAAVAAGRTHSVALQQDGTVWTWGDNRFGQLGNGASEDSFTPVKVPGLTDVVAIAAGYRHVVALKRDGTIWAWGSNHSGQLGKEGKTFFNKPIQITELQGVSAIAAGSFQTAALKSDGTVWTWGFNGSGQLGSNSRVIDNHLPVKVAGLRKVIAITAGNNHMVALRSDGTAWAWGSNIASQLGNDSVYEGSMRPMQVSGLSGIKDISAKVNHTFALMQDGTVMAWGDSSSGQWGNGISMNGSSKPVMVQGVSSLISIAAVGNPETLVKMDSTVFAGEETPMADNLIAQLF